MSDEERATGASPEMTPEEPTAVPPAFEDADLEASIAAESAATIEAEQAPAGTGPMTTPPPIAPGWEAPPAPPTGTATEAPPMAIAPPVEPPLPPVPPATAPTSSGSGGHGGIIAAAIVIALIVGAMAGVAGGFLGGKLAGGTGSDVAVSAKKITVVPSQTDEPVIAAAAAAVPSVVNINVSSGLVSGGQSGLPQTHPTVPSEGQGSGVAYKKTGDGGTYILTNNHVVETADQIEVKSTDGKSWPATLVGRDPDNDIAVVKVAAEIPVIDLGDSSKLVVGQTVVAIGSPYGLEHSVTSGIVSAMGRLLPDTSTDTTLSTPLTDVIQTDAAINPGNSGGALVDKLGKLVGINTAIYTESGSNDGIGFAVPVNTAIKVADQLITSGKVVHPFIGVVGSTVDERLAAEKKLTVKEGALVEEVVPGTGSAAAGIKPGDVITSVDGEAVRSMDDLVTLVRRYSAGDTVSITLIRDGQSQTVKVKIGDRPADFGSTGTTQTPAPKK